MISRIQIHKKEISKTKMQYKKELIQHLKFLRYEKEIVKLENLYYN
jgi:hypothetical protein